MTIAQADVDERRRLYEQMAGLERHAPDDRISSNGDAETPAKEPEEELP
jgi:hypothetical protein